MSFLMLRRERCIVLDRRKRNSNIVIVQNPNFLATYFRVEGKTLRACRMPAASI
jgi:hypothetical protein